jgi:hypothetical protein
MVIYINTVPQQATIFWRRCPGKKEDFYKGSFARTSFTLF